VGGGVAGWRQLGSDRAPRRLRLRWQRTRLVVFALRCGHALQYLVCEGRESVRGRAAATLAAPLAQHIAAAHEEAEAVEQRHPYGHREGGERRVGER
jgi:hypothetical protein